MTSRWMHDSEIDTLRYGTHNHTHTRTPVQVCAALVHIAAAGGIRMQLEPHNVNDCLPSVNPTRLLAKDSRVSRRQPQTHTAINI